ncbi:unnamed protein product [Callosobruchus maculatus]|uniref:Homeobox domain-containing protein n=1 Tax=Callosobruchus maculatus TaxID=64391 RepID=A0A653C0H4_CALMS|nr:unnamed protein product [Callosobruchus maculatus]
MDNNNKCVEMSSDEEDTPSMEEKKKGAERPASPAAVAPPTSSKSPKHSKANGGKTEQQQEGAREATPEERSQQQQQQQQQDPSTDASETADVLWLTLKTKLNQMRLNNPQKYAIYHSDVDDSAESSSDDGYSGGACTQEMTTSLPPGGESVGGSGSGGGSGGSPTVTPSTGGGGGKEFIEMVDRLAKSKFFQAATDDRLEYLKKVMKGDDSISSSKQQRKARPRVFTDLQLKTLEKSFQGQKFLSIQDRMELAATLGLTDTEVKKWYQKRRTKLMRQAAAGPEAGNNAAFQVPPYPTGVPGMSLGTPDPIVHLGRLGPLGPLGLLVGAGRYASTPTAPSPRRSRSPSSADTPLLDPTSPPPATVHLTFVSNLNIITLTFKVYIYRAISKIRIFFQSHQNVDSQYDEYNHVKPIKVKLKCHLLLLTPLLPFY